MIKKRSFGARHQARVQKYEKIFSFFKKVLFGFFCLGVAGAICLTVILWQISKNLPDIDTISNYIPAETTKIYSSDNVVLAELHLEENRELIPIEKISLILQKAVVTVEDINFFKHNGIDFKGILRALVVNIKAGRVVQGGSTLTQQLARNLFLTKKRNISRKLAEAILAVKIERKYTKIEILQMYLNQVYWGHNAYGIESASRLYFGKSAKQINLAESAMLVGLLTGPELYSPIRNFDRAKKRQKIILNSMAKNKIITKDEAGFAYQEEIVINKRKKLRYKAPYFTAFIVKQLIKMFGEEATYTSGMKVYTTLNYKMQKHAESVVEKYIEYGSSPKWVRGQKVPSLNYSQAAILAIDPRNGDIKTMVGGKDYLGNMFNRTTQAMRQPGSAFKPFLYLAALEEGFSPGSVLDDSPVTFNTVEGPYAPRNYTQKYLGKISIRKAFERSVNVIAIKLNDLIGPEKTVAIAKTFGIKSELRPVLSLPLGANEVNMLELTTAYGTIASYGKRVDQRSIIRIEDREGTALFESSYKPIKVAPSNAIAALIEMMKGIVDHGTGKNAKLPRPVAGKTGTTSDYRDAWFVGFVPQLVCTTWVGNDDNKPTYKITGGWVPARMWREFMKVALEGIPAQNFSKPRNLVKLKINWQTEKLATEFSPEELVHFEKFWKGKEPTMYDSADDGFWKNKQETEASDSFLDFFDNG